jgi:hypothetical protein
MLIFGGRGGVVDNEKKLDDNYCPCPMLRDGWQDGDQILALVKDGCKMATSPHHVVIDGVLA